MIQLCRFAVNYSREVKSEVVRPQCRGCGRPMAMNGTYKRTLCHGLGMIELIVQRFRCRACNTNASSLPVFALKHCRYALWAVEGMLNGYLTGMSQAKLAASLAPGGVCERTISRLLNRIARLAGEVIINASRVLAEVASGEWQWLKAVIGPKTNAVVISRMMVALKELSRKAFQFNDRECGKPCLLTVYEAWRRGCYRGFAKKPDISRRTTSVDDAKTGLGLSVTSQNVSVLLTPGMMENGG
jgi:hypothetical protein